MPFSPISIASDIRIVLVRFVVCFGCKCNLIRVRLGSPLAILLEDAGNNFGRVVKGRGVNPLDKGVPGVWERCKEGDAKFRLSEW
jgi:hypothetical protein